MLSLSALGWHSMAGTKATHTIRAEIFIVGDLAFYGMCLGKEGMSGKWCHICKIAAAQMGQLGAVTDDLWKGIEEVKQYAADYKRKVDEWEKSKDPKKSKTPPKPQLGVKDAPWWDFIPLDHYIVPLLHCNIGIGDVILSSFRDFVSEHIEYINEEEAAARSVRSRMEEKIGLFRAERDAWKKTEDGKKLDSLKNKRRKARKSLEDIGALEPTSRAVRKVVINYVEEANLFLQEEDMKQDQGEVGEVKTQASDPSASCAAGSAEEDDLKDQIKKMEGVIVKCDEEIKLLEKKYKYFTSRVDKTAKFISGINKEIAEFKSVRKNRGDGLESEMIKVLLLYDITIQAYHGGSLHGKDVQKLMSNAHEIFDAFADILTKNMKEGCEYKKEEIQQLCKDYATICILWDGAFSYASTINPTEEDINMYERFVTAAVHVHVKMGLNVTPKVHMMWAHVLAQMKSFEGGLGNKREDWGEKQHQETSKKREQYRSTKNMDVRADAMAGLNQQESHPDVVAHGATVDADACRGPRKDYTSKEEERKKKRDEVRISVLKSWEVEMFVNELIALS